MPASEAGAKKHIVQGGRVWRYGLRSFALGYLALLLMIPVGLIFFKAFEDGFMHALDVGDDAGCDARLLSDDGDGR